MKAIQYIKAAAGKLRDSKLKRLGGKEITEALEGMMSVLRLDCKEEAIIFAALFDRSCGGRSSDLDDIATYFGAAQLDVMEYVPALKSLIKKGYVMQTDLSECQLVQMNFMVTNYVIGCILDNRVVEAKQARILEKEFDHYDLCKVVDAHIQDCDVTTEMMLQSVESVEGENPEMPLVKGLKRLIPELKARALFYEVCNDFFYSNGRKHSGLNETMRDMYEAYGVRFKEMRALLNGTHPLIKADLVEISSNREKIILTTTGQQLLLGEDFSSFGPQYMGLNLYSFARTVAEYVHSDEYDLDKENALERLAKKIRLIEDSNRNLAELQRIKEVIREEDNRALFYMACDACAGGDMLSITRELSSLYPVKERNQHLKEFKEETHKLQRLDLLEMMTHTSLFGEYTVLQLTDRGKELFFGEDASLYIEKPEKKELIAAADIKEKHLFFAPAEARQLDMVGRSLQEENYKELVERLDAKGLPNGIAILLYGAPGTGKTESVMQWGRATGRDIIHVDISGAKSMWYGESEKIIKEIFTKYKRQCKRSARKPILLFNEADAIFASRKTGKNSSIDQTENAIQNIILEEMEKLDGILIATTNLAENLDKAFERRFLFKIRLEKPSIDSKRRIWSDKLPALSQEEAYTLAAGYDFSGGEIDNIVRKALMAEVLDGTAPSLPELVKLCREEKLGNGAAGKVGFRG